jgi:peptide/nickel transport system substrate-binding protein
MAYGWPLWSRRTGCRGVWLSLVLIALLAGCAAPQGGGVSNVPAPASQAEAPRRTLVVVARGEPPMLAAKPIRGTGGALDTFVTLYNATLDWTDDDGNARPYLAESVPQVNTDSWRVSPDGQMETTYKLRPNLTWHDGKPLSAEDFVFAHQVYRTPDLGVASSLPISAMAEVTAPDPQTVVIRWGRLFPDAGSLKQGFQALPRHILEGPFSQLDADSFTNLPFWGTEYVGLGPYRLDRWEPGAYLEGTAFDGHALGRAKIDRVRVNIVNDTNAAIAALLSGEAHFTAEYMLWYEEAATLQQQWQARGMTGKALFSPTLPRITQIQLRPEFANPPELLDVRFRRALAHAIDNATLVEVLTANNGAVSPSVTAPLADYAPQVQGSIAKYPYDPRRAQQLMEEAGLTRSGDGMVANAAGPLNLAVWHIEGSTNERENAIITENLKRAGIGTSSNTLPTARLRDNEFRSKLPALFTGGGPGGEASLLEYSTSAIPGPDNRWQGGNRGGWVSQDFDRYWQAFNTTLDRSQRVGQIVEMERILSEDVGTLAHYYSPVVNVHVGNLEGPTIRKIPETGAGIRQVWTWQWKS